MGNEFKIKKGFISEGDSKVNGVLSAQTINVTTTPTNDNSQTQVLVRNNTSGLVEYRDASTFSGASGSNTFITGYTYNNNNTFTISDNAGSMFTATINQVSGLTVNGILSATTLDGSTILSGGTNLLTIIETLDTYVTGGTVSIPATDNTNSATIGLLYKNSEGVPHTLPFEDTYASGTTFSSNEATLTRNDGSEIFKLSGGTNVTLFNPSSNQIKIDVTIPTDANTFVTGGTYTDSTNTLSLNRNDAVNVDITGLTDSFVTATTLNSTTIELDRNEGLSTLSVDLLPVLSGKTNLTLFNTHTGDTANPHQTSFTNLTSTGHTHPITDVINLQTILDTKVEDGLNVGGANEIFSGKSGTTLIFRTISGGSNTTITQVGNVQRIDVSLPPGSNTFVTGFTYNGANTLTIFDNVGSSFPVTINTVTGLTVAGIISATTISGGTLYGDGSNLTGIASTPTTLRNITSTDTFSAVDETINCTSGTFIVNLPTAIGIQGTPYTLVNSGTGVITLKGTLGQTINGSTTIDIKRQYVSRTVQSDGSNWIII